MILCNNEIIFLINLVFFLSYKQSSSTVKCWLLFKLIVNKFEHLANGLIPIETTDDGIETVNNEDDHIKTLFPIWVIPSCISTDFIFVFWLNGLLYQ